MNTAPNPDDIAYTLTSADDPAYWRAVAQAQREKVRRYRGLTYRQAARIDRRQRGASRLTSVVRPVRRTAPTRRAGAVVARRRAAGTGKPAARGDDSGQPGEPSGLAARAPRALSAHSSHARHRCGLDVVPKEASHDR